MIDIRSATPDEIRRAGIEALVRGLGVAGMLRFMQQYEPGHGDYTRERLTLLGNPSAGEVMGEMEAFERSERRRGARPARKRKGRSAR